MSRHFEMCWSMHHGKGSLENPWIQHFYQLDNHTPHIRLAVGCPVSISARVRVLWGGHVISQSSWTCATAMDFAVAKTVAKSTVCGQFLFVSFYDQLSTCLLWISRCNAHGYMFYVEIWVHCTYSMFNDLLDMCFVSSCAHIRTYIGI